ncbi:MAG: Hsp33 family molecular chaperone HslO [Treponema sp.]|nr:Hsp33 family molecular chaperone HslO [Treponema sp.]
MIKAEITDSELNEHLNKIHKDELSMFVMADRQFRGAFFNATRLVNKMRAQHNLGILETMILGQALICAGLLIPLMKGREHLTFRYDTNGPAAGFSVEADSSGYVRGFLFQNHIPVFKPLENWNLEPFLGEGTLTITRMGEGMKAPQVGTVEIMYKNIAEDLAWYFLQSEQIHTAFNTSVQFDSSGRVTGAGGMFIQYIPGDGGRSKVSGNSVEKEEVTGKDELISKVENAFRAMPSIGKWFSDGGDMDDVVYGLFREFSPSIMLSRDIIFDCPCSKDYYVNHIKHLSRTELDDIIENDPEPIEIVCHNCASRYEIYKKDLV